MHSDGLQAIRQRVHAYLRRLRADGQGWRVAELRASAFRRIAQNVLAGRDPGDGFSAFRTVREVFSNGFQGLCRDGSLHKGGHILAGNVFGLFSVAAFPRAFFF